MRDAVQAASTISLSLGATFSALSMSLEQAVGGEVSLAVHMAPAAICTAIAFVNAKGTARSEAERSPAEGAA